jgi:CRISPR-associated protein Cas2
MRVIVFFDLPTITVQDRKEYIRFRKLLLSEGFIMMQQSVYTKIVLNGTTAKLMKEKLRKLKPKDGLVQMLTITEKQFSNIEYLCGTENKSVVNSIERLIVL